MSQDAVDDLLSKLVRGYKQFGISRSVGQTYYRARLAENADGFENAIDMIHPPTNSRSYGRASLPGPPVLYASWNILTALEEVEAEPDHYVQVISLRVKKGIEFRCAVLGEFQSVWNSGGSLINSRLLEANIRTWMAKQASSTVLENVFVDSFLAEQFRRRAEHHSEYKLTAAYAQRILPSNAGLIYLSVQAHRNMNLAVSASDFAENYEVMGSLLMHVTGYAGYGLFLYRPLKQTHEIDQNGYFVWDSRVDIEFDVASYGKIVLDPDRRGWGTGVA